MAILNVTPDSFHDGGTLPTPQAVADRAACALEQGATLLDIGGESTRPGAAPVTADEQIARVVPAIRAIRAAGIDAPISVDTTLATVARAALHAGADAINDIAAGLDDDAMLPLAAETGAGLVLMHRRLRPADDVFSDRYETDPVSADIVADVRTFLEARLRAAFDAGVRAEAIVLDPGLGFGKSVRQNLELIARTGELLGLGYPVLSAASRKSFIGRVSLERDSDPSERLAGSIAVSVAQLHDGAKLFRVHDPGPHAEALRAAWAVHRARAGGEG